MAFGAYTSADTALEQLRDTGQIKGSDVTKSGMKGFAIGEGLGLLGPVLGSAGGLGLSIANKVAPKVVGNILTSPVKSSLLEVAGKGLKGGIEAGAIAKGTAMSENRPTQTIDYMMGAHQVVVGGMQNMATKSMTSLMAKGNDSYVSDLDKIKTVVDASNNTGVLPKIVETGLKEHQTPESLVVKLASDWNINQEIQNTTKSETTKNRVFLNDKVTKEDFLTNVVKESEKQTGIKTEMLDESTGKIKPEYTMTPKELDNYITESPVTFQRFVSTINSYQKETHNNYEEFCKELLTIIYKYQMLVVNFNFR